MAELSVIEKNGVEYAIKDKTAREAIEKIQQNGTGDSGGNVDLTGYATEEFVKNKIAEAELGGEEVDLSGYAQKSELPTKVSQLENDSGYLTEHQDISGKLDASALPSAINSALAQAKASGEFDGQDGATPNIKIGTVETLAAGSPATASMTGTPENPLLNLGIPQGNAGNTPVKGIHYFTDADKTELVNAVLAALPVAEGVSY